MSAATEGPAGAPTIRLSVAPAAIRRRHVVPRRELAAPLGAVLTVAVLAMFVWTADRIFAAGYLAPMLGIVWDVDADAANAGGQWLVQALLGVVRAIPRAGPELLVMMTMLLLAGLIGALGRALYRRGWPAVMAVLAALLVALHPVTLYLASTGQPAVLGLTALCLLLLTMDRVSVLGDAQSLMGLGLCFALLFVTDPNALYLVLPVLAMLPLALKDMRDSGSIAALFLICLIPSTVSIATLLVGSMIVGVAPETTLRHWVAVLHGSLVEDVVGATWLSRNGGTFFGPFVELVGLCLVCVPMSLLILWRLLATPLLQPRRVAVRLPTAVLAAALAPLAGAFAVLFWHPQTQWNAIGGAIVATCVWGMTVHLRRFEQIAWLLALVFGLYVSWDAPWLWTDPDKTVWRAALLGRF
jgi:hypothetical protein